VPLGLTLSRGSWLATAAAALVVLLFAGGRPFVATLACGAAAAVVLVGGFGIGSEIVGERIASIGDTTQAPDPSTNDRYALWSTAVDIWLDHPATGVGLREFARYRDTYAPLSLSSGSTVGQSGPGGNLAQQELLSPHTQYLLVLAEQGAVGFVPFAALLVLSAAAAVRATLRGPAVRPCLGANTASMIYGTRPSRGVGAAVVGIAIWQLLNFVYGDLGGATSLITAVIIGLALWYGLEQSADDGAPARSAP
jgi:O-antigen ligase